MDFGVGNGERRYNKVKNSAKNSEGDKRSSDNADALSELLLGVLTLLSKGIFKNMRSQPETFQRQRKRDLSLWGY